MANWQTRFKGDFISAAELGDRRPTFTIARVSSVKMKDDKDQAPGSKKEVDRAAIHFKEIDRPWLFCKTSGHSMAAMFGENDDGWVGKRVTLYSDPTIMMGPEQVGGIRVAGSPDIPKTIKVRIKFPKKKAIEVTLTPTAAKTASVAPRGQETSEPVQTETKEVQS